MLGRMDWVSMKLQFTGCASRATDSQLAENNSTFGWLDGKRPQIKKLVVKRAQRQAIGFNVWSADVMPFDVSRFKTSWRVPNSQIEAADTAAKLVGAQHPISESRVALASCCRYVVVCRCRAITQFPNAIQVQTQSGHDVSMKGIWKIGIQNAGGYRLQQPGDMT